MAQPDALQLADSLDEFRKHAGFGDDGATAMTVKELRRLHAVNAELLEALKAAIETADFEGHQSRPWHYKAIAAIKKAEGV